MADIISGNKYCMTDNKINNNKKPIIAIAREMVYLLLVFNAIGTMGSHIKKKYTIQIGNDIKEEILRNKKEAISMPKHPTKNNICNLLLIG
ncbi:MAG: hypothetical protein CVT89_03580 [Candidatus Altiarchaeales archaeon HGW-Altiarchaeales-2]|nr:MAG: hypothetical protein CVT89_03580 [Candidatus Altiarchaeales archaeon HGW-Altiarchaeales-2]